jgi:hypothetical protein
VMCSYQTMPTANAPNRRRLTCRRTARTLVPAALHASSWREPSASQRRPRPPPSVGRCLTDVPAADPRDVANTPGHKARCEGVRFGGRR